MPAPHRGGAAAQPARPAAVGGFVAVGMPAGVETDTRSSDTLSLSRDLEGN